MIEAVNSVVSNAQFVRGSAEQQSSAGDAAAQIRESSASVPKAPYISPYIAIDTDSNSAVIQVRDSDTGDVVRQFPSESSLRARQSAAAAVESRVTSDADVSDTSSSEVFEAGSFGVEADVSQASQAAQALSTAAAAQTSEIAQSTVNLSA